MKNLIYNALILLISISIMVSCKTNQDQKAEKLTGQVLIDGSSTVYPISEAVAEEFRLVQPGVRVTVGESGTGGGFKKFSRAETDINNASRPIRLEEAEACKANGVEFLELEVAYDGLAVMVHPNNTWANEITVAELKILWEPEAQGKITRWNQIRPEWPDKEIHLYGAGTASGTFDYFTEVIVGKAKSSRGDYTASEDDNVLVQGISSDELGLGYFGLAYYENNKEKLKLLPIDDEVADNGHGPILPNLENVKNKSYSPLSRPLFIYVNSKSLERKEVQVFVSFYIESASQLASDVGYIPLSEVELSVSKKRWADFLSQHSK